MNPSPIYATATHSLITAMRHRHKPSPVNERFTTKGRSINQPSFSLVELVIVVVIVGIIAAVAIPRINRAVRTSQNNALKHNLAFLREAIELYAAEHDGKYPPITIAMNKSLTQYTNLNGDSFSETKDTSQGLIYGPYLKLKLTMSIGDKLQPTRFNRVNNVNAKPPGGVLNNGWWYNEATGDVRANLPDTELDEDGVPYNTY